MKEFYKIKTTDFKPISFNDLYLFNQYDKIKNFLKSKNQIYLLEKLAIPKINKKEIYWFSQNKKKINKLDYFNPELQKIILEKYKDYIKVFNDFLTDLNKSKNQDNKNWNILLSQIINGSANELFYDGENIYITWGWELINENSKSLIPKFIASKIIEEATPPPLKKNNFSQEIKIERNTNRKNKISFLDKCHLFIRKNWWITPSLTIIIFLLLILGF